MPCGAHWARHAENFAAVMSSLDWPIADHEYRVAQMNGWIFDLDGTLVESLPGIAASLNRSLAAHGLTTYSEQTVRGFIGDGIEMLVRRALSSGTDEMLPQVIADFREDYGRTWQSGTTPYDGIVSLLALLQQRGEKLAVLSNKPHAFTESIVGTLFPGVFHIVLGQRSGVPHKPDPTGLREILQAAEWHCARSFFIGDSLMDLQTAQAAAVPAIAVSWGYHERAILAAAAPCHLVGAVAELRQLCISLIETPRDN